MKTLRVRFVTVVARSGWGSYLCHVSAIPSGRDELAVTHGRGCMRTRAVLGIVLRCASSLQPMKNICTLSVANRRCIDLMYMSYLI